MDRGCDCGPASPEPLPPQGSPIAPHGQGEPQPASVTSTAAPASPEANPSWLGLRSERGRPPDRAVFLLDRSLRI